MTALLLAAMIAACPVGKPFDTTMRFGKIFIVPNYTVPYPAKLVAFRAHGDTIQLVWKPDDISNTTVVTRPPLVIPNAPPYYQSTAAPESTLAYRDSVAKEYLAERKETENTWIARLLIYVTGVVAGVFIGYLYAKSKFSMIAEKGER